MTRLRFSAVVESGSCDPTRTRWEERVSCGHAHKTIEAAETCGAKHYNSRYVNGSWTASALWHGYTVHDQDGRRANDLAGLDWNTDAADIEAFDAARRSGEG